MVRLVLISALLVAAVATAQIEEPSVPSHSLQRRMLGFGSFQGFGVNQVQTLSSVTQVSSVFSGFQSQLGTFLGGLPSWNQQLAFQNTQALLGFCTPLFGGFNSLQINQGIFLQGGIQNVIFQTIQQLVQIFTILQQRFGGAFTGWFQQLPLFGQFNNFFGGFLNRCSGFGFNFAPIFNQGVLGSFGSLGLSSVTRFASSSSFRSSSFAGGRIGFKSDKTQSA